MSILKKIKKILRGKSNRGKIIYWKDKELDPQYKFVHAVSPTETGQCEVEGCNEYHGPIA